MSDENVVDPYNPIYYTGDPLSPDAADKQYQAYWITRRRVASQHAINLLSLSRYPEQSILLTELLAQEIMQSDLPTAHKKMHILYAGGRTLLEACFDMGTDKAQTPDTATAYYKQSR